jgi:hypothetical protein
VTGFSLFSFLDFAILLFIDQGRQPCSQPKPGRKGFSIYVLMRQSGPVIPPGAGLPILLLLNLQGYNGGILACLQSGFFEDNSNKERHFITIVIMKTVYES